MSKQHILKIHPKPLADLLSGAKTAEVRRNDRGFQVGDTVRLMEVNPETGNWTGAAGHVRTISHIQTGYGLPDGICVLSYAQAEQQEAQGAQAVDERISSSVALRGLIEGIDHVEEEDFPAWAREVESAYRAALATQPAEQWIACSDRLPDVSEGCQQEFIVCAKRNQSGKLVVMAALYLNAYPLYCEDNDEADEDGNIPHTGWYDAKSNGDDANCYSEIDDSRYAYGAKVTHWMPLPQPAVRGAEHDQ